MKITIPFTDDWREQYFILLKPFHNLSQIEIKLLLQLHSIFLEAESAPNYIAYQWVLSSENRKRICKELSMKSNNFNVYLSKLKTCKIFNISLFNDLDTSKPYFDFSFIPTTQPIIEINFKQQTITNDRTRTDTTKDSAETQTTIQSSGGYMEEPVQSDSQYA